MAGPFAPAGAGAGWAASSRHKTVRGYGRWLAWLIAQGVDPADEPPAQRVTPKRVAAYVQTLHRTTAPFSVVNRIQELRDALRVLDQSVELRWLADALATLRTQARGRRDKRRRLQPSGELVRLGRRLMREAEAAQGWSARRRALAYRDGLMIALLAFRPLRIKNFASLCLARHLVAQGDTFTLLVPATETKNRRPYEAALPDALAEAMRRYLAVHRPVLLAGEQGRTPTSTDALWVSEIGTQLELGALARRIVIHTRAAFGASIPPHWFRDAAATSIAIDDPEHVRDAHLVLGHASPLTTERHYNQARGIEASRRYGGLVAALRDAETNERPDRRS